MTMPVMQNLHRVSSILKTKHRHKMRFITMLGLLVIPVPTVAIPINQVLLGSVESISISIPWPISFVNTSTVSGRPILLLAIDDINAPTTTRVRIKVFAVDPVVNNTLNDDQKYDLGNFSIYPATGTGVDEFVVKTFAFDLRTYLDAVADDRQWELFERNLQVDVAWAPFDESDNYSEVHIEIHSAEIIIRNR